MLEIEFSDADDIGGGNGSGVWWRWGSGAEPGKWLILRTPTEAHAGFADAVVDDFGTLVQVKP